MSVTLQSPPPGFTERFSPRVMSPPKMVGVLARERGCSSHLEGRDRGCYSEACCARGGPHCIRDSLTPKVTCSEAQ